jgi:hypothetical protein
MATSTNYLWAEPNDSDLVKNGALAIRTLGNAIDASLWNSGYGQAGKNKHINADFGIWQRGTSFAAVANNAYTADRWQAQTSGTGVTISQQTFTPAAAPVAGYESAFFMRIANDGTSATCRIGQPIEDVRVFAGQTVTLSFWAKSTITDAFATSFILQSFGTGGSAQVATSMGTMPTVTSSWARYSIVLAVPSISGKTIGTGSSITFQLRFKASAVYSVDLWGVQVEYGSTATPFQTASGNSPQSELAMCQRYYYRNQSRATGDNPGSGYVATADTNFRGLITFPVEMRTSPTALEQNGTAGDYGFIVSGNVITCNAVPTFNTASRNTATVNHAFSAVILPGQGGFLRYPNANGYLGWSAEL